MGWGLIGAGSSTAPLVTGVSSVSQLSVGVSNNIKGSVFENILDSAARRQGGLPFFRTARRGGLDLGILQDGTVVLNEAKFQNRLQYDDFTAITKNLRSNVQQVLDDLPGNTQLSRADKEIIRTALQEYLQGRTPPNLRIRVDTGKGAVGPRLQKRLRDNVDGLAIDFREFPK